MVDQALSLPVDESGIVVVTCTYHVGCWAHMHAPSQNDAGFSQEQIFGCPGVMDLSVGAMKKFIAALPVKTWFSLTQGHNGLRMMRMHILPNFSRRYGEDNTIWADEALSR